MGSFRLFFRVQRDFNLWIGVGLHLFGIFLLDEAVRIYPANDGGRVEIVDGGNGDPDANRIGRFVVLREWLPVPRHTGRARGEPRGQGVLRKTQLTAAKHTSACQDEGVVQSGDSNHLVLRS